MNIQTYLTRKYAGASADGSAFLTTITKAEAMVLGIEYPLRSGWLGRHGDREITPEQARKLIDVTTGQAARRPNKPDSHGARSMRYAMAALAALSADLPVAERAQRAAAA